MAALETRTEGWVAALQLAALSLQGRDDPARFIDGLRRRRPVRRGLPRRRGPRPAARPPAPVPARHLGARPDDRTAVRRRHRPYGRAGDAGGRWSDRTCSSSPSTTTAAGTATTTCSPTSCARACSTSGPATSPGCIAGPATGTTAPGTPRRPSTMRCPRATPTWPPTWSSGPIPALLRERREDVIRRWADELPADVRAANRPVLAVGLIGGLMSSNEFDGIDRRLVDVEAAAGTPRSSDLVVARPGRARPPSRGPWRPTARRSRSCTVTSPGPCAHAERALAGAAADDHLTIASASALLGLASWTAGTWTRRTAPTAPRRRAWPGRGTSPTSLGCAITLADIEMTQGRLGAAQRTFERCPRAGCHGRRPAPGRGRHVRRAEPGRAGSAATWPGQPTTCAGRTELGESAGLPQHPYRWRVALAQLRAAEGDATAAVALLDEAERVYVGDFAPDVRPVAAARARVLAASGDVPGALDVGQRPGHLGGRRARRTCTSTSTSPWPGLSSPHHAHRRRPPAADGGDRPARPAPGGGRGGWPDGQRHRDPGPAGGRTPQRR